MITKLKETVFLSKVLKNDVLQKLRGRELMRRTIATTLALIMGITSIFFPPFSNTAYAGGPAEQVILSPSTSAFNDELSTITSNLRCDISFGTFATDGWRICGYEDGNLVILTKPLETSSKFLGSSSVTADDDYDTSLLKGVIDGLYENPTSFSTSEKSLISEVEINQNLKSPTSVYLYAPWYVEQGLYLNDNIYYASVGKEYGNIPLDDKDFGRAYATRRLYDSSNYYVNLVTEDCFAMTSLTNAYPVVCAGHLYAASMSFVSKAKPACESDELDSLAHIRFYSNKNANNYNSACDERINSNVERNRTSINVISIPTDPSDNEYLYLQYKENSTDVVKSVKLDTVKNYTAAELGFTSGIIPNDVMVWIEEENDELLYAKILDPPHNHEHHFAVTTTKTANDTLLWYCTADGCKSSATAENPERLVLEGNSYPSSASPLDKDTILAHINYSTFACGIEKDNFKIYEIGENGQATGSDLSGQTVGTGDYILRLELPGMTTYPETRFTLMPGVTCPLYFSVTENETQGKLTINDVIVPNGKQLYVFFDNGARLFEDTLTLLEASSQLKSKFEDCIDQPIAEMSTENLVKIPITPGQAFSMDGYPEAGIGLAIMGKEGEADSNMTYYSGFAPFPKDRVTMYSTTGNSHTHNMQVHVFNHSVSLYCTETTDGDKCAFQGVSKATMGVEAVATSIPEFNGSCLNKNYNKLIFWQMHPETRDLIYMETGVDICDKATIKKVDGATPISYSPTDNLSAGRYCLEFEDYATHTITSSEFDVLSNIITGQSFKITKNTDGTYYVDVDRVSPGLTLVAMAKKKSKISADLMVDEYTSTFSMLYSAVGSESMVITSSLYDEDDFEIKDITNVRTFSFSADACPEAGIIVGVVFNDMGSNNFIYALGMAPNPPKGKTYQNRIRYVFSHNWKYVVNGSSALIYCDNEADGCDYCGIDNAYEFELKPNSFAEDTPTEDRLETLIGKSGYKELNAYLDMEISSSDFEVYASDAQGRATGDPIFVSSISQIGTYILRLNLNATTHVDAKFDYLPNFKTYADFQLAKNEDGSYKVTSLASGLPAGKQLYAIVQKTSYVEDNGGKDVSYKYLCNDGTLQVESPVSFVDLDSSRYDILEIEIGKDFRFKETSCPDAGIAIGIGEPLNSGNISKLYSFGITKMLNGENVAYDRACWLHNHEWTFEADGSTLKAYCVSANNIRGCIYPNIENALTIELRGDGLSEDNTRPYDGESYAVGYTYGIYISDWESMTNSVLRIRYYMDSDLSEGTNTTKAYGGAVTHYSAPKEVGTYYIALIAEWNEGGETRSASAIFEYSIVKAERTGVVPTVSMTNYDFGTHISTPTVIGNDVEGEISNIVTYYYYADGENPESAKKWSVVTDGVVTEQCVSVSANTLEAGTYHMYAVLSETEHFKSYKTAPVTFRIVGKTLENVVTTGYEGEYDGENHSITVTCDTEGCVINYGFFEDNVTFVEKPQISSIGTTTIYYKISKFGYETVRGTLTIKIVPKKVDVHVTVLDKPYDGTNTGTVTASVNQEDLVSGKDTTYSFSGLVGIFEDAYVGEHKLVTINKDNVLIFGMFQEFYEFVFPETAYGNIVKSVPPVEEYPTAKPNVVYIKCGSTEDLIVPGTIIEDGHFEYRLGTSGEWGLTVPKATGLGVGNYTVYYRIIADNENRKNDTDESYAIEVIVAEAGLEVIKQVYIEQGTAGSETSGVSCNNLEELAEGEKVSGKKVIIKLEAEAKLPEELAAKNKKALQDKLDEVFPNIIEGTGAGQLHTEYLDIHITKTIEGEENTQITDTNTPLEIGVSYVLSGTTKNIMIFRYHEGEAVCFTRLATRPTDSSAFVDKTFYVDSENDIIYLYSRYYSDYVVAYVKDSCTVTFDSMGGSDVAPIVVAKNGTIAVLPQPEKTDMVLDGWFMDSDCLVAFDRTAPITSDITLYAKWSRKPVYQFIIIEEINILKPDKVVLTKKGETLVLKVDYIPANATYTELEWKSSDEKVATVDQNGVVTAVGEGKVTITVITKTGKMTSIELTVKFAQNEGDNNYTDAEIARMNELNTLAMNAKYKVEVKEKKIVVSWGKVNDADGYIIYATYCGTNFGKPIKTISSKDITTFTITKLKGKALDPTKNFKVYVKAYKIINGEKKIIARSITAHIAGKKNAKYTNVVGIELKSKSSVTLKVGKTSKIKAEVVLQDKEKKQLSDAHVVEFRYASSDSNIATVDKNGKIKAKKKGTCYIYVYAKNGYAKKIKVTVK